MNTLAIDIGGTKYALGLFAETAAQAAAKGSSEAGGGPRLVRRAERKTDRTGGPAAMLPEILRIAREWQQEAGLGRCGVGFGGPVDFAAQRVAFSTHVGGWDGVELRQEFEAALGVPTILDNDANAAALGEAHYGAGHEAIARGLPVFYMTISTGIGGGLVLGDGTLYRGANHWAAEIGHMPIRPEGPACLCGSNGCLERMCCGLWLERDHGRPARELFEDAAFVAHYVVDLALGIKAAIMILNPAVVVLGGGVTRAGEKLFGPLRAELARQMPPWSGAMVDVRPAGKGDDHVLWGAYALAATLL